MYVPILQLNCHDLDLKVNNNFLKVTGHETTSVLYVSACNLFLQTHHPHCSMGCSENLGYKKNLHENMVPIRVTFQGLQENKWQQEKKVRGWNMNVTYLSSKTYKLLQRMTLSFTGWSNMPLICKKSLAYFFVFIFFVRPRFFVFFKI